MNFNEIADRMKLSVESFGHIAHDISTNKSSVLSGQSAS